MPTKTLQGIGASPGLVIGPILCYEVPKLVVEYRKVDRPEQEISRLQAALYQAQQEVNTLSIQAMRDGGSGEAAIFEVHEMFLSDPELLQQVRSTIEMQRCNAEYAWQEAIHAYAETLRVLGNEYLAERTQDIEDVQQRVLRILQGTSTQATYLEKPVVIVSADLAPSDTVVLEKKKVLAFCTASGGPTSHVAILSKALGIPAVVGLGEDIRHLDNDTLVIVDGTHGEVLIEPDTAIINQYQQRINAHSQRHQEALKYAHQPATTLDGKRIEIAANLGGTTDAKAALEYGAEGIGLLRTEFLFLNRDAAPDEEEQLAVYRAILQAMGQHPVVARTLDIGGDKPAPYLQLPAEMNPFLGIRGLRLTLMLPDLFQTQLRALLRAGAGHHLKIMFPMVTSCEEIQQARQHIEQARADLSTRRIEAALHCEVGIMVEVPAAALMADRLAEVVDFFSIGTNDLAQYTLAADRTNTSVTGLADALHPAVLRLIHMVVAAARPHHRRVAICGELASDPLAVPILLGLGLDELSMNAHAIPLVKQAIRHYTAVEARSMANHALALDSAAEVRAYLQQQARS
jgi:phosphoenolpyruvate-protein phosphotransferase